MKLGVHLFDLAIRQANLSEASSSPEGPATFDSTLITFDSTTHTFDEA